MELIFFLDFVFSPDSAMGQGDNTDSFRLANEKNKSVFGGGRVGAELTGGVDLANNNGQLSAYSLNNGFSSPTGSQAMTAGSFLHIISGLTEIQRLAQVVNITMTYVLTQFCVGYNHLLDSYPIGTIQPQ